MGMRGTSGDRAVLPGSAQDALAGSAEVSRCADVWCIVAGVPCQDVSVAGKRTGLHGERTGLFFEFARILRELRPAWFIFENVPGLLSSNGGRDFAEVLRVLMVECGYGVCWRVLDSQFFGVAQRRRRLFIVGRFGKPCPAEVLFEPASKTRSGEARKKGTVAITLTRRNAGANDDRECWIESSQIVADGAGDFAGLPEGLDSARYRALGNAITVPVMRWIAARIKTAETKAPCVREEEENEE